MKTPPGPSKQLAAELASLAASPDASRIVRLMLLAEPSPPPFPGPPADGADPQGPRPIAYWAPREVDGELYFVPPESGALLIPDGHSLAERPRWRARKEPGRTRVCYFGESVATGLHYAPDYAFGKVIASTLATASQPQRFELIDLSRAGLGRDELIAHFGAAMQLAPEVAVVMAGNNWRFEPLATPLEEAAVLREEGYPGLVALSQRRGAQATLETMATLAGIARAHGVRVVWVIPEANQTDFAAPQPVAWLPDDGSARWHALYQRGIQQLAAGASEEALRVGQELVALDGGSCASSHRLCASALHRLGRTEEARAAYQRELSVAVAHRWTVPIPRIAPEVQEAQRRGAAEHGFGCVDTPRLLRASASHLPGRDVLYDYCHYSQQAMRQVSAAITLQILESVGQPPSPGVSQASLTEAAPRPSPQTEAGATFGAFLGNAMISEGMGSVAQSWCEEALAAHPEAAGYLVDQMEMVTGPLPPVLTAAFRRVQGRFKPHFGFPGGVALETLGRVLATRNPAQAERLAGILQRNLGLTGTELELTQQRFTLSWEDRFMDDFDWGQTGSRHAINTGPRYRAPWPRSSFFAFHSAGQEVSLSLAARLPSPEGERVGTVGVSVNGQQVGELRCGPRWTHGRFTAPAALWRPGFNRICVHWPSLPGGGQRALETVAERWEEGRPGLPFPVFGELATLTARLAAR